MQNRIVLAALSSLAIVHAQSQVQGPAPTPVLLTATQSGVLPIIPTETPFTGLLTNQGAIINRGPPRPGFVGPGGSASVQTNNPAATYRAELPPTQFNPFFGSTVRGSVVGVGTANGVQITVNVTGLPAQTTFGPFMYHIHTLPVPADGNCTSTLSHFDPTNRGELYMCDTSAPATCQVGDLAGKHGAITTANTFSTSYVDQFLSTNPSSSGFFGGLSIVFHSNNATRITCANFVQVSGGNGTTTPSGTGVPTGTAAPTSNPTSSPFPGAAAKLSAGFSGLMALGLAAFLL